MSIKKDLFTLLVAPEILDRIAEKTNIEKDALKELVTELEKGHLEEVTQMFMILDGEVTVEEIQATVNLEKIEILDNLLKFAPEVLQKKEKIADRLLEEGYQIPGRIAIQRLSTQPQLAEHLDPSYLGQLLLSNKGLIEKIDDDILPYALETLEPQEITTILPEKTKIAPLLSEDTLLQSIQLLSEDQKGMVIRKLSLTELDVELIRKILYNNLSLLEQDIIESGIQHRNIINSEMAQKIADEIALNPLVILLQHYPQLEVKTTKLAQVLRKAPSLVEEIPLERLEDTISYLIPKDCLPILENAEGNKFLLFFRYVMKNEVDLLKGRHFQEAIDLGLEPAEIGKNILENMQKEALEVVLTAFPTHTFYLDIEELPLHLVKKVVKNLSRDTIYQKLTHFPPETADVLYDKLSQNMNRFWAEMKSITDTNADIITSIIAYAPKKMRDLFLSTYGDTLKEKARNLGSLISLMKGNEVSNLKATRAHIPSSLLPKLYVDGIPIDPASIWREIKKYPWALEKVVKESPTVLLNNIQDPSLSNLIKIFDTLEEKNKLDVLKSIGIEDTLLVMTRTRFYPQKDTIWRKIVKKYPRFCLLPQAPSTIRIEAALTMESRELLEEVVKRVKEKTIKGKSFEVLHELDTTLTDPMLKHFLTAGNPLTAGGLCYLLYHLANKTFTSNEVIELLQSETELPHRDEFLSSLQNEGILGFVHTIVKARYHTYIPKEDIVRVFGQPVLFQGQVEPEVEVDSNMISAILLEHVKLEKKKKLLRKSFLVEKKAAAEKEISIEGKSYDQQREDQVIGKLIVQLVEKSKFVTPLFLIMTYHNEILPKKYSIKQDLKELPKVLSKIEKSSVSELQTAARKVRNKIIEIGAETPEFDEDLISEIEQTSEIEEPAKPATSMNEKDDSWMEKVDNILKKLEESTKEEKTEEKQKEE